MGHNQKKGLIKVLCDILRLNGKGFWAIVFSIVLIVLFLYLKYGNIIDVDAFYQKVTSIVPDLLGFVMSGYTILYGIQGVVLKRLNIRANDGNQPFHVISASFALTCLSLLATLIMAFLLSFIKVPICGCGRFYFFVTACFAIISVVSICNTILHLFSIRTQISPIG